MHGAFNLHKNRTNEIIKKLIAGVTLAMACSLANAAGVNGSWTTEPGKDGGHLEVTIAACASDASKTCGTISKAYEYESI